MSYYNSINNNQEYQNSYDHNNLNNDNHSVSSYGSSLDSSSLDARKAFQQGNVEASKRFHQQKNKFQNQLISTKDPSSYLLSGHYSEAHQAGGTHSAYLRSIVYGGLDGIITTFATVSSIAGAGLSPEIVLIIGMAHIFADGISMGTGDAMSITAEHEYNSSERKREKWEMDNNMDGEIDEMIALYIKKGISMDDSNLIIRTLAKYKEPFLDHMMVEELGLMPIQNNEQPITSGLITMLSFILFGSIPLLPYLVALIPMSFFEIGLVSQLYISIISTMITLFILGSVKGALIDSHTAPSPWKSGLIMAFNGSVAAIVGFFIGKGMRHLIAQSSSSSDNTAGYGFGNSGTPPGW